MSIDFDNVAYGYKDHKLVDNLTITVGNRGITCIVGANGVGKTTLLKSILNIHKDYSGSIYIDGKSNREYSIPELSKKLSYVSNSSNELFSYKLKDYLTISSNIHHAKMDYEELKSFLATLGLDKCMGCKTNTLSTGQLKMASIIRGLSQGTQYILFDEPTANLDVKHQAMVMNLIKNHIESKKRRAIIVCHDINMCIKYADDVLMIYGDGSYNYGNKQTIITECNIEKLYGVNCKIVDFDGLYYAVLDA